MTCQEREIMSKRREYVQNYKPPVWTSPSPDPVSGQLTEIPMVTRASIFNFKKTICFMFSFSLTQIFRYCIFRASRVRKIIFNR